jgi:hypothetical protein
MECVEEKAETLVTHISQDGWSLLETMGAEEVEEMGGELVSYSETHT